MPYGGSSCGRALTDLTAKSNVCGRTRTCNLRALYPVELYADGIRGGTRTRSLPALYPVELYADKIKVRDSPRLSHYPRGKPASTALAMTC